MVTSWYVDPALPPTVIVMSVSVFWLRFSSVKENFIFKKDKHTMAILHIMFNISDFAFVNPSLVSHF